MVAAGSSASSNRSLQSQHPQQTANNRRFEREDFDVNQTLGVGAFGFVKLVWWKVAPPGANEDSYYALKCVSKEKIIEHNKKRSNRRKAS